MKSCKTTYVIFLLSLSFPNFLLTKPSKRGMIILHPKALMRKTMQPFRSPESRHHGLKMTAERLAVYTASESVPIHSG